VNAPINPNALPYAVPRSVLPGAAWPAIPNDLASRLLALQLQFGQSQWWPPEVIQARQFEQLRQVLAHAQRTVPFYGSRLSALDLTHAPLDRENWSRIPILSRKDVQLNRDALRSRSIPAEHGAVREVTTSGSTGRPVSILSTELPVMLWQAIALREHLWHRRDLTAKLAVIRVHPSLNAEPPDGVAMPTWGPPTDLVFRTGPAAMLNGSCAVGDMAAWLCKQDPDYLLTTATRALALARHFRRTGLSLPRLRQVRTYGEAMSADLREQCRETWRVPVVDMYSSREIGYMALQCPLHEHYHVQSENILLEILDEQGNACRDGEIGRVVISTLHNFATPLIRYEIGDYAESGGSCPCGRGLPVIRRILGRVRNMMRMPDGSTRWPDFMLAETRNDLPAAQMQIVQTAPDVLELRAVPARHFSAKDRAKLLDYMRQWAGPQFHVSVRIVDDIPRGPGGKFEEFMSLLDPQT
jgi:phenylacetate-CoA ligase